MNITCEKATINDANDLMFVQDASFYSDYKKYGECPGYHVPYEQICYSIQNNITYKLVADGKTVGKISCRKESDTTYFIGCLCVIPAYENNGIATYAMRFLLGLFPHITHWQLETPTDNAKNHLFYQKFDFHVTKTYMVGNVSIDLLEK